MNSAQSMGVSNMALSEKEELEMLELEKEQALSIAKPNTLGEGKASSIRAEYPSEKFARYAEPISQFGGMLAKTPFIGTGLAGLATGAVEAVKQGIQAYGDEPGRPKTSDEASRRILMAGGRGALGEGLGRGIFAGASKLVPSKQVVSQGIRAMTGIPEKSALRVLKDPAILSGPGKKEAGAAYGKAFEDMNITTGEEGVRETFGKSVLPKEKMYDLYDELTPALKSGDASLQTAFSLRKAMSDEIGNVPMAEKETLRRLAKRINILDDYIEGKVPEWGGLRKGYADAMAAEEFNSWLPRNKNLSPNVLRTTAALATSIKGAAEGRPLMSLALPAVSPKVYGGMIRVGAAAAPAIKGAAFVGSRLTGQGIANMALPSSTEELMRKHYNKQGAK